MEKIVQFTGKKVLISPLNWGLGHATRCIPLIEALHKAKNEVTIAADGDPLDLLKDRFPYLKTVETSSYRVIYSEGNSQIGIMLLQLPLILQSIWNDNRWLHRLLKTEQFDIVISDNRFGLWNRHVHSIYMTHQIMIKMPRRLKWAEPLAYLIHRLFIGKYDECWIPDQEENGLSGDLSHRYPLPPHARYIGPLSRFEGKEWKPDSLYDVIALISGPQPHRRMFEEAVTEKYRTRNERILILRAEPQSRVVYPITDHVHSVGHLPDDELAPYLLGCKHIICRSGYSSLMDLSALNCLHKAELSPTPGQTEQEYLAELHRTR